MVKLLNILLLLLLLCRETLGGTSFGDENWRELYTEDFINATNSSSSNNNTAPEIAVGDDRVNAPTDPGDTTEAPPPNYQFLPPTRAPSLLHPSAGPSDSPSGSFNVPGSTTSLPAPIASFIFVAPLKATGCFVNLLNWHRLLEHFLPTQFNHWRRLAHRDFCSFMSSYEQQLLVNNLRYNPMGSFILRMMKLTGMVAGCQVEDMLVQLKELHYVDAFLEESEARPIGQSYMEQLVSSY